MTIRILLFSLLSFICTTGIWGQNFIYPHIPDSIIERDQRIKYLGENFFEQYDVKSTSIDILSNVMSDFMYILSLLKEEDLLICVNNFVRLFQQNNNTFGIALDWIDKILYDSTSPLYNEELYLRIISILLESDIESYFKIHPNYRKEIIEQNRIGFQANDFIFFEKTGKSYSLYDISAKYLLLFFNNPECDLCQQVKYTLRTSSLVKYWEKNGMKIFAISPDVDENEWKKELYDNTWIVGIDRDNNIYNYRLYDIQRLPTFYLLDSQKRVLLKEASIDRVLKYLKNIY